jgi:hypothetical protein
MLALLYLESRGYYQIEGAQNMKRQIWIALSVFAAIALQGQISFAQSANSIFVTPQSIARTKAIRAQTSGAYGYKQGNYNQAQFSRAQAVQNQLRYQEYLRRRALQRGHYGGAYYRQPVVAYQPNVVWLPTGATLNTAGRVSADGRYFTGSIQPFFSSVPAVHTYNLGTGQLRRIR